MAIEEHIRKAIQEALRVGDVARCEDLVRSTLLAHPHEPRLWVWLGKAQRMGNRFEEAITSAEHAVNLVRSADAIRPGLELHLAITWFEWGRSGGKRNCFERARDYLHQVADSAADTRLWQSASVILAACEHRLGDPEGAIARNRAVLNHNPGNTDALFNLALLLESRAPAEAEQLLRTLCQVDPTYAKGDASITLSGMLCYQGRRREAEEVARTFLAAAPNDHRAMIQLAEAIGPQQEAIELLRAVLADDPASWHALQCLGGVFYCLEDMQEAERLLRRALDLGAMNVFVVDVLVKLLCRQHRLEEALEIAMLFRSRRPDLESSHEVLSRVYLMNENLELALQESMEAVAIDPMDPDCLLTYGNVLIRMGDLSKAEEVAARLAQLDPGYSAKLRMQLG